MKHIEDAFKKKIKVPKFIPYIQLHEFEALLFSDPGKMYEWLSIDTLSIPEGAFQEILDEFKGRPGNDKR